MATYGSLPSLDWGEVSSGATPTTGDYLRTVQTRKHLRTKFDLGLSQIARVIYDDTIKAGETPIFIRVEDTTPNDPMWAIYKVELVTLHKGGSLTVGLILAYCLAAIVAWLFIASAYYIATGKKLPGVVETVTGAEPNLATLAIIGAVALIGYGLVSRR